MQSSEGSAASAARLLPVLPLLPLLQIRLGLAGVSKITEKVFGQVRGPRMDVVLPPSPPPPATH